MGADRGVVVDAAKDDIVWVPRGTVHHNRNVGSDLSLRLAVAMPPAWHLYHPCEQCGFSDDGLREWCAWRASLGREGYRPARAEGRELEES